MKKKTETTKKKFLSIAMDEDVVIAYRKYCVDNCMNMTKLTERLLKDFLLEEK